MSRGVTLSDSASTEAQWPKVEVAQQERAERVPRAFGIRPSDDDKLGAIEAFGLSIRRIKLCGRRARLILGSTEQIPPLDGLPNQEPRQTQKQLANPF